MLATLSPEAQVARILESIGCAQTSFSEIAGKHSTSRVLAGLQGKNDFSSEDGEFYLALARKLKQIADDHAEVPIKWSESVRIKQLLKLRELDDQLIRPVYIVEFGDDRSLFEKVENGICRRTFNSERAAILKDQETASAVIGALDRLGYRTSGHLTRMRVPESRIVTNLIQLGFTA